jgi:O-antigen/teichoic acid export membrane protein
MLPIYTRYLTRPEYGALEIFLVTSSIIMYVLQLGMGSALFRNVIYKEGSDRRILISTAHYFLLLFALFVVAVLVLLAPEISIILLGSSEYVNMLRIIFIGDFFLVLATIPMTRLMIDEKSGLFAIVASGNFVIGIGLNILFIIVLRMGLFGAVLAMTLNAAAFAIIYTAVIWKDFVFKFSRADLKDMLGFGLPLVPANMFALLINMADRYFIRIFMGLDQVAVYGAAARLSIAVALIVNAFQMSWPAILFSIAKQKEGPQIFARLFNYFNAFLLLSSLVMSLFAYELLNFITGGSYSAAAPIVSLLVFSSVFYGVNYFTSIGVQVEKKTLYYPVLVGISAVINLSICYFAIPVLGLWGAGIAKVAAFAFLGISICLVSLKYYSIPFQFGRTVLIYSTAILLYGAGVLIDVGPLTGLFKLALIFVFILSLFAFRLVETSHVKRMLLSVGRVFVRNFR